MYSIRLMTEADIPDVLRIQSQAYDRAVLESEAVFRARRRSNPQQAWVAHDAQGVCAYLFGYRSQVGQVTPLEGDFHSPENADCLYLHDLAVARRAAGRKIGPALVNQALSQARQQRLRYSALVSVQDSQPFWSRLGYAEQTTLHAQQAAHLASYRIPATYMVCRLN